MRIVILVAGCFAVALSYVGVLVGPTSASAAPGDYAFIALPGMVAGIVMLLYGAWEARNVRAAKGAAGELSAQLVRKEIEIGRLATIDELTGLYTRREFDEMVRLEIERTRRHGRDVALVLLEIDDITELGLNAGKLSKGYLISEVSGVLRGTLRANDVGCRYTPDCLAMLLPETNLEQARAVAEKVRSTIGQRDFFGAGQDGGRLTVSQGIAVAAHGTDPGGLMRAAERALGDAKVAGYDRVAVFDPSTGERDSESGNPAA